MEYHMNELSLTLPGDRWNDATTNALDVEAPDGSHVVLEIKRGEPVFSEDLSQHVDADLQMRGRTLRGFELLGRQAFEGSEVAGISASFRSVTREGGLHYEVAYVPLNGALLLFTVTAPAASGAVCREVLVSAVESIRLRRSRER
jgi:hypothetical protein